MWHKNDDVDDDNDDIYHCSAYKRTFEGQKMSKKHNMRPHKYLMCSFCNTVYIYIRYGQCNES